MQGGLAWLLSEGQVFTQARSPEELLQKSLQAAVTLVDGDPNSVGAVFAGATTVIANGGSDVVTVPSETEITMFE